MTTPDRHTDIDQFDDPLIPSLLRGERGLNDGLGNQWVGTVRQVRISGGGEGDGARLRPAGQFEVNRTINVSPAVRVVGGLTASAGGLSVEFDTFLVEVDDDADTYLRGFTVSGTPGSGERVVVSILSGAAEIAQATIRPVYRLTGVQSIGAGDMGNGYSSAPMVSISPSYGAVIETVINSDGEVTGATLTRAPNRTFSNGPPTLLVTPPPVQYSADVEVDGRGGRTHQFLECASNRPYLPGTKVYLNIPHGSPTQGVYIGGPLTPTPPADVRREPGDATIAHGARYDGPVPIRLEAVGWKRYALSLTGSAALMVSGFGAGSPHSWLGGANLRLTVTPQLDGVDQPARVRKATTAVMYSSLPGDAISDDYEFSVSAIVSVFVPPDEDLTLEWSLGADLHVQQTLDAHGDPLQNFLNADHAIRRPTLSADSIRIQSPVIHVEEL